jgi:hypothetical protein
VSSERSLPVVMLEDPRSLGETVSTEEQLRLWRFVYEGGAAILMAEELPEDHIGRMAGSQRGIRLLPHVPVRFGIGLAAGNFMGRCHVAIEADAPRRPGDPLPLVFEVAGAELAQDYVPDRAHARLLLSHEASLSPAAMIVGALPARTRSGAITLNHYRNRAGTLVASMPFGHGKILFVGLPLLQPIADEPDPLRDRTLSGLIESVALEIRNSAPGPEATARPLPLTAEQLEEYTVGMEKLVRLSAVADRYSFITSGKMAPASLALGSVVVRDQGLAGLFHENDGAWEHLRTAFDGIWTEDSARFVMREEDVLARLKHLIQRSTAETRVIAAQVVQEWGFGVMAWVQGDSDEAHARLDAAEALLLSVSDS